MENEGFQTKSVETEEISERELKYGYWYITHKEKIKKIIVIGLIIFSIVTIGYSLITTGWYYVFQYKDYKDALNTAGQDYVNVLNVHRLNTIQPLEVLSRQALSTDDGKFDLAVHVKNTNEKWALKSVEVQFSYGGKLYTKYESFVMPGEEKYFLLLNVEGAGSGSPQVFLENEKWWRVVKYENWGPQRLNFIVTDKKFVPARQGEISGKLQVSEALGEITNATAYNYNQIEVQIALLSGSRLVGISKVVLNTLSSGEKRSIASRWTSVLPPVTSVEIIPTVNILDEKVYQEFEGEFDPSYLEVKEKRY